MRFLPLIPLFVILVAGTAFGQAGGQAPQIPEGFTAEQAQKFMALRKTIGEALQYEDYEKALPALVEQNGILEKALEVVSAKETASEDDEKKKKMVIGGYKSMAATNWYNIACCQSMLEAKAEAVEALAKAIELGFIDLDKFRIDSDLDNIRKMPEYKKLIGGLDYNEVFEVYTPESAAGAPVGILVGLHWTNYNEKDFLERFKVVADKTKMVLVVPRAPITLAPNRFSWRRRSDDTETGQKKISFVIDEMKKKDGMADLPVYLMGIGDGGAFATMTAFSMPAKVKGAIQVNSYWNKYYMEDLLGKAKELGLRIALVHGDKEVYFPKAKAAIEQMTAAGVSAKLIEFDGEKKLPDNEAELLEKAVAFLVSGK